MKPRELMDALVEHEDTMIDALSLSLRNVRYGKGKFAFFNSNDELISVLVLLYGQANDEEGDVYRIINQIRNDFRDEKEIHQDTLTRLRTAVAREIKACLTLLANIDKAKESLEFQQMWKEKEYGYSKEANDSDEEVRVGNYKSDKDRREDGHSTRIKN